MKINKKDVVISLVFIMLGFFIGMEYKAYQIRSALQDSFKEFRDETELANTKNSTEKVIINKGIGDVVELATLSLKITKTEEMNTLQSKYSQPVVARENTKFLVIDTDITNTTKSPFFHRDA